LYDTSPGPDCQANSGRRALRLERFRSTCVFRSWYGRRTFCFAVTKLGKQWRCDSSCSLLDEGSDAKIPPVLAALGSPVKLMGAGNATGGTFVESQVRPDLFPALNESSFLALGRHRPRRVYGASLLQKLGGPVKSLFDKLVSEEILQRIDNLQPEGKGQWGKMDVAQMLAHCCSTMEVAAGRTFPPRMFIGRILGPIAKKSFVGEKPFSKNSPTDPSFVVSTAREFSPEREHLKQLVRDFCDGQEAKCTRHPHPFFGPLSPTEWSTAMYKHLDHHLRQFSA